MKAMDDATGDEARIDNPEDMKRKLRICDGLLSFWQTCVQRVSTIKKIPAHCVASLCTFLPETIKIIFEHCKARYQFYIYRITIISKKRDMCAVVEFSVLYFCRASDVITRQFLYVARLQR